MPSIISLYGLQSQINWSATKLENSDGRSDNTKASKVIANGQINYDIDNFYLHSS